MGIAPGAADRAPARVVGIFPCTGPPYLGPTKQWAAVRTHCGVMRDPPQMCTMPIFVFCWMLTIHGQEPGWASVPPTMRDVLR